MATEELKTNVELDTNVKKVQIQRYEPEDFPETHYLNEEKGLRAWLTTVDHKKIGLMYLGSTTFFFFVGGILAIILRTELLHLPVALSMLMFIISSLLCTGRSWSFYSWFLWSLLPLETSFYHCSWGQKMLPSPS